MRTVFAATLIFFAQFAAHAADTAYSALRVVGRQHGKDALNRVVEVRGRSGTPEPAVWKIVLDEPRARGGVREVEVQRGRIIAERTPVGGSVGAPMNFNQLNLDSEGAFAVVNQEAQKAGVPFERVDYSLRSGPRGSAPIWELQLFSRSEGEVANIQIAADSGAIVRQSGLTMRGGRPYPRYDDRSRADEDRYADDREYGRPRGDYRRDDDRRYDEMEEREPIRDVPSFFRRVGQHFQRRGVQIKRFFTGE